jgi:hypothetical protein
LGQSGTPDRPGRPKTRSDKPEKGNRYLKGVLAEGATGAATTDTFLGERYRRRVRRRDKQRALVAVSRSILVIIWHLLADRNARFTDLGPGNYDKRIDKLPPHAQPRPAAERLGPAGHPQPGRIVTPWPASQKLRTSS